MDSTLLLLAALGGILPAFLWLFFWLREDKCEPEPRRYILFSFILGMFVVDGFGLAGHFSKLGLFFPSALSFELWATAYASGPLLLLIWAALEELFKFGAAYVAALRLRVFDEPLDAVVYMVTVALGFSAYENFMFLLGPLQNGDAIHAVITGDLRFIGATLAHTLSSAVVGLALAYAYYKPAATRRLAALGGVILAILLHTLFNFFILKEGGENTFWVFLFIWLGVVGLLFFIEQVKQPARDYC